MTALLDRFRLFSLRELAAHRGRTVASMTVMAVSAAFLVAIIGITGSVTGSLTQLVTGIAGNATLEVSGVTDAGFPAVVRDDVAAVPGVASAVPMVRTSVATPRGPALLLGANADAAALDSALASALDTQLGALITVPRGVLAGANTGYRAGDAVPLAGGQVTVAAVPTGGQLSRLDDGHYLLAPLALAQRVTGRPRQLDSVLIQPARGVDPATLRADVSRAVRGRAVVAEPTLRAAQTGGTMKIIGYMGLMGASVAFVVAAFLIYTAMTMAVSQRRPVISLLRAVGGRRGTIVGDLLAEAAVLGLVGGAAGAALGVLVGRIVVRHLPTAILQGVDARLEYALPGYAVPLAVAAAVGTSVLASAVAARQVYRVSPVEALAPVGAAASDVAPRPLRLAAGIGGGLLAAASVLLDLAHLGPVAYFGMALQITAGIGIGFCFARLMVDTTAQVARIFGAPGAIAAATVERAPRRVWATLMTVVIAVVTTVGINGVNANLTDSARAIFAPLGAADGFVSADAPDEFPTDLLPPDVATRVAAVPGIAAVQGTQLAWASVNGTKVMLDGVVSGSTDPFGQALDPRVRAQVEAGAGVALSKDLGGTLGVRVGDELTLQTPQGERRVRVLQLVPYFSVLSGTVALGAAQLARWYDRDGATSLRLSAAPGADRARLLAQVRRVVPSQFYVYDGPAALHGVDVGVRQGTYIADMVWVIVVFIAAVALLNTLTLSVLERRRELGVLRAMGSSRRFSLRMVLAEAAAIGVVGGVIGLLAGIATQYLTTIAMPDMMNFDVRFRLGPSAVVFALGAVALSLVGAAPPATRAARLNIIDAVSVD